MHFFERVKARLRNRDAYQDFLKCLNLFAQEIITKQELVSLVQDILGRYSDLMVSGAGGSLVQAALAGGSRVQASRELSSADELLLQGCGSLMQAYALDSIRAGSDACAAAAFQQDSCSLYPPNAC
jgi:hypothetical protein